MRARITTLASAALVLVALLLGSPAFVEPAAAAPEGLKFTDSSTCIGTSPRILVTVVNVGDAPVTLHFQSWSEGTPALEDTHPVLAGSNYTFGIDSGIGKRGRVFVSTPEGEPLYDSGYQNPCDLSVTPTISCDADSMTISVALANKGSHVVGIGHQEGPAGGGSWAMIQDPEVRSITVPFNRLAHLWVEVDDTIAYDSGELYATADGCGQAVPPVGQEVKVVSDQECADDLSTLTYRATVTADQEIGWFWSVEGLGNDVGSVDVAGTKVFEKAIPAGATYRLTLSDFLGREVFDSGELLATVDSAACAPTTTTQVEEPTSATTGGATPVPAAPAPAVNGATSGSAEVAAGTLPRTGTHATDLVPWGLGLVASGSLLAGVARKRRHA